MASPATGEDRSGIPLPLGEDRSGIPLPLGEDRSGISFNWGEDRRGKGISTRREFLECLCWRDAPQSLCGSSPKGGTFSGPGSLGLAFP